MKTLHVVSKFKVFDSDWSTTRIVDIVTPDYTLRHLSLKRQWELTLNSDNILEYRLEATLSCDSPYDIDDNPDDDTATARYSKDSQSVVEQGDILVSIVVASLLLIIAFFGGAFTKNPSEILPTKKEEVKAFT